MKILLIPIILLGLAACKKDSNPNSNPGVFSPSIQGVWIGNTSELDINGNPKRFYFIISNQVGSSVSGQWNYAHGEAQGSMQGSITSNGEFDFHLDEGTNCAPKGSGTADLNGKSMNMTFSGNSNCNLNVTDVTAQLSFNGL